MKKKEFTPEKQAHPLDATPRHPALRGPLYGDGASLDRLIEGLGLSNDVDFLNIEKPADCKSYQLLIAAYHLKFLSEEQITWVKDHLPKCALCNVKFLAIQDAVEEMIESKEFDKK